ncbi:hypothetical protein KRP22_010381 [Phytophthora ramorum]|nr:hypothetical protein KRP22_5749 [Phytophthora ramorum]
MTSVDGDYEEEWEAEEPFKKTAIGGQVYPLEGDENNLTREAEPTQDEGLMSGFPVISTDHELTTSESDFRHKKPKAKIDGNMSDEAPTSDDSLPSMEDEKASTAQQLIPDIEVSPPDLSSVVEAQHLLKLIRIHGQHYGGQTPPPPIPVMVSAVSKDIHEAKSTSKHDVSALQARVAAKRISDFRRRQTLKADEERALESAWTQKRREVRRSNDAMYKALGVAGLSAQDHLRIANRRRKQEAKEAEMVASQRRQHRWYNNTPKRLAIAPDHIRELNMEYSRVKWEQQRAMQLKQNVVRENELELRQKARAIITKANGAYVRGSFLLKLTHHTLKTQKESPSKVGKEDETA